MIFISFIYLLGGSFIDDLAFMILATPIFFRGLENSDISFVVRHIIAVTA